MPLNTLFRCAFRYFALMLGSSSDYKLFVSTARCYSSTKLLSHGFSSPRTVCLTFIYKQPRCASNETTVHVEKKQTFRNSITSLLFVSFGFHVWRVTVRFHLTASRRQPLCYTVLPLIVVCVTKLFVQLAVRCTIPIEGVCGIVRSSRIFSPRMENALRGLRTFTK